MSSLDALAEHFSRNPHAQHRAMHDAEYAAEVHRLREMLRRLDAAMNSEALPADVQRRIAEQVVSGYLTSDAQAAALDAVKRMDVVPRLDLNLG